ncbi:IS66 family insertion sequence element accessory protein TnpA [Rhodocytophaga aerolata]
MFPLVEGWLKSGLTQKLFCSNHRLPVHILAYCVGRYRKSQPNNATTVKSEVITSKATKELVATEASSGFICLSPLPSPTPALTPLGSMEVVLPTGAVIHFLP